MFDKDVRFKIGWIDTNGIQEKHTEKDCTFGYVPLSSLDTTRLHLDNGFDLDTTFLNGMEKQYKLTDDLVLPFDLAVKQCNLMRERQCKELIAYYLVPTKVSINSSIEQTCYNKMYLQYCSQVEYSK